MSEHGNSLNNQNLHHLYSITDTEDGDVFKYGISDDPIEGDGLSPRLRQQVNLLNRAVGFLRFLGKILIINIPGRVRARKIEDAHIDEYIILNGRRPRGNPRGGTRTAK